MRERGILFSAPMVLALLAGRKTQTRRIVKPQPRKLIDNGCHVAAFLDEREEYQSDGKMVGYKTVVVNSPYGTIGDRLWVRETFSRTNPGGDNGIYFYRADEFYPEILYGPGKRIDPDISWTPSIHMPRAASRITLEVKYVRVERLFDISEEDCRAEGMLPVPNGWTTDEGQPVSETARRAYEDLWYSINGAWLDCWVWVIEFRRVA